MLYKFLSGGIDQTLGPRQVRVIASTGSVDHENDVLSPHGCDLETYRRNPIVLADHDPTQPIGTAMVELVNGRVEATITFAPEGISEKADTYCGLMKSGVLKGVSVGFNPIEAEPRGSQRSAGRSYKRWKLLELSVVAVPANPDAVVIARAHKAGRVLSGANATRLRTAHDLAEQCRSVVRAVLDDAGCNDGDQDKAARARRLRQLEVFELSHPPLTTEEKARAKRLRQVEVLKLSSLN